MNTFQHNAANLFKLPIKKSEKFLFNKHLIVSLFFLRFDRINKLQRHFMSGNFSKEVVARWLSVSFLK